MRKIQKQLQLQIRVAPQEKMTIQRAAKRAGMGMSEWVLSQILPAKRREFQQLLKGLKSNSEVSYVLAELNDLLANTIPSEFEQMIAEAPRIQLSSYLENYVAAMIECAANKKDASVPVWVQEIPPLERPVFGSDLENLRLYLLTHSPVSFRNRNIFVDTSIGGRL